MLAAWAAAGAMMSFMVLEEKNTCNRAQPDTDAGLGSEPCQVVVMAHNNWLRAAVHSRRWHPGQRPPAGTLPLLLLGCPRRAWLSFQQY